MIKQGLNVSALILESVGVWKTMQITMETLGQIEGAVFASVMGVAVYSAWYLSFNLNLKSYLKRGFLILTALLLMSYTAYTIDTGSKSKTIKAVQEKTELRQAEADRNYMSQMTEYNLAVKNDRLTYKRQESARIAALTQINKEIKVTKKAKQPEIYRSLLSQQASLSAPSPKPAQRIAPTKDIIKNEKQTTQIDILSMIQSGAFGLLVPILLLMSAMIPAPKPTPLRRDAIRTHDINTAQPDGVPGCSVDAVNHDGFKNRAIPINAKNEITLLAIQSHYECGERHARTLRKEAISNGFLRKKGNRYYYKQQLAAKAVVSDLSVARQARQTAI